MKATDWRELSPERVAPLYDAERARWAGLLDWDSNANWLLVEAARAHGTLPGYVVLDRAENVAGWAFYYLHEEMLQIGGLTGRTASVARCLLDTIMRSPEATRAKDVSCFVLPDRPSSSAFVQRRFDALRFLYLRRPLGGTQGVTGLTGGAMPIPSLTESTRVRAWHADDATDTVRLLASAYDSTTAARCFAPGGRLDSWMHYVRQLIRTPACGVLLPTCSFSARAPDGSLCGVVLTTSIGLSAVHVAQLVVSSDHARQGIGRRLLDEACAVALSEGRRYVTLLVSEDNAAARALYGSAGFEERSQFLFGWRTRPIPRSAAA